MSAKQRSLGERHPICQEGPAQSLAAGWARVLSCLLLPPFPSNPTPKLSKIRPSPSCLLHSAHFCLNIRQRGVCQARTELLDEAGPLIQKGLIRPHRARRPVTPDPPDLALGAAIRSSARSGVASVVTEWTDFANPRSCPVFSCIPLASRRLGRRENRAWIFLLQQ